MADEKPPFWEDPEMPPDEAFAFDKFAPPESYQKSIMDALCKVASDPVYELRSIFGVNHRTAERWISGATNMRPPLQLKLARVLGSIASAQRQLEKMSPRDRLFLQLAAARVELVPLPKED